MNPGEIKRIPNTALKNARRPDGRKVISWLSDPVTGADQIWPQNAGTIQENSIMRAESGGDVCTLTNGRKVLAVCGGGHGDGAHFGLYGLLLPGDTPQPDDWTWVCLIEHPQLFNGQPNWPSNMGGNTFNPDGSPVSRHTWAGIRWLPHPYNRLMIAGGATWPLGYVDPQRLSWFGNLDFGVWEQGSPFPSTFGVTYIVGGMHFLPPNKVIWTCQHMIMELNLDTGVHRKLNGNESIDNKWNSFVDVENHLLYFHYWSPALMRVFDLEAVGSKTQPMTVSGDLTAMQVYRPGYYGSKKHGHVMWVGGNDLYLGKRTGMNMHYEKVSFSGDIAPPKVAQGMYGKFNKLDPDGDTFIIATEVANDVYIGTMDGAPPDVTPPQAPTLTAQPAVWS
jgi:hypothetical protein